MVYPNGKEGFRWMFQGILLFAFDTKAALSMMVDVRM